MSRLIPPQYRNAYSTAIVGVRDRRYLSFRLRRWIGKECPYCGAVMGRERGFNSPSAPSRDHKMPRSRGGSDDPDNLIVCCRSCNEDKASLTYDEYLAVITGAASRLDRLPYVHYRAVLALNKSTDTR